MIFACGFLEEWAGYRETNWGVREANSTHVLALAFCWAVLSLSAISTIVLKSKSILALRRNVRVGQLLMNYRLLGGQYASCFASN